ncbi:hypothetical protein MNBD_ALPHA07-530 [hydrothermal vent metagenome]|uniref:DUF296 domain-containing protein n=1 Tax=hydrothermal vent metagenome TaxID=652676 RepID=A0A3B0TB77_9ZZZZ
MATRAALPKYIQQPGPDGAPYISVPTGLTGLEFDLPAGVPLHLSLAHEIKARGLTGGYFRIKDAAMAQLHYVIPALSKDDKHVAWYSDVLKPEMPGRIVDAGIICGFYKGAPYYHCHGRISDASGKSAMGHLLPEACVLSQPTRVIGHGFTGARFTRNFDPQTGFELFTPQAVAADPFEAQAQLLRIAPNTEISAALTECCHNAGWTRATVQGIGSLIGAHFADGRVLDSFATEFLITKGEIDLTAPEPNVALDIVLVGLDGGFKSGRLKQHSNPVLITSEIILIK